MLSVIASYQQNLLWVAAVQGVFTVLYLSASKGWQYLIEGQRQRAAERIACKGRAVIEVRVQDRRSFLHVRSDLTTADPDPHRPPPPPERNGETLLADIILLDAHRKEKLSESSWAPPA